MPPRRTAVVFLTHLETARIVQHFARLKAQTRGLADVFLCVHGSGGGQAAADFRVTWLDAERILPRRYEQCRARGGKLMPGFTDLAYMPALLSAALARYRHVWLVEYDVDYAGDWAVFFAQFEDTAADFLGTTVFPRSACEDWFHWSWFKMPFDNRHHHRSFVPIVRFSQPMLACYRETIESGAWEGHTEALFPSIASANGFSMQDIGGRGPLAPPALHGRNYSNVLTPELNTGTMTYRPVRHWAYFHETPENFFDADFLYHPVKPDGA